ncbi:MAG: biotin transporter BioY [Firmicutes bacterium]|nr:biotin transporter BioY [Bacillota bacterium]
MQLNKTRELVAMGLFTALTCMVGLFFNKLAPVSLVPFSFLPMMSLLAGMLLGSRGGALSMLAYMLMGLIGIPVFSSPPYGGPTYVIIPTFGFVIGFILSAFVVGKIMEKKEDPKLWYYGLAMLAGIMCYYAIGIPYLWAIINFVKGNAVTGMYAIKVAFLPFILTDLAKAAVATVLARAIAQRVKLAVHQTS